MNLLWWIVVGIALYWVAITVVSQLGWLPASVRTTGPVTTIRTTRGRVFLDRLAQRKRFWRAWANMGVGIALVVMVGSFVVLLLSALLSMLSPAPDAVHQPQNVLVIPGVNQFLPLEVAPEIIIGLVVGLVVHEGGHGLLCRVENIEIESMGVAMLAFIPLGAFVEPNHDSTEAASRGAKTRMFAAGVTFNFAITIVVFALLFGPVAGSLAVAPGAPVGGALPGSAAEAADIGSGDRITELAGQPVSDYDDLVAQLEENTDRTVSVKINDDEMAIDVERSLLVTAATPAAPGDIAREDTITAIGEEELWTLPEYNDAIEDNERAEVAYTTAGGEQRTDTIPLGAFATVRDGPLEDAGVAHDTDIVIVEIDGERIPNTDALQDVLDERAPGQTVNIAFYEDDERHDVDVELGADGDRAIIGVFTVPGTTGMEVSDFGIQPYPADEYLALLGGGDSDDDPFGVADSFLGKMVVAVFLPLASIIAGTILPFNFPGFTSDTVNFFVVQGPLEALGGSIFLLANILFWTGWININLGFFNCIPAIPLDGGHLLRSSVESIFSRLPLDVGHRFVSWIVGVVALMMLASFLLLIFGAGMLAP